MSEARRLIQVRRPGLIVPQWPFTLNRQTPQAEGLVGWWPNVVSGGTKIHDLAGRGLNGVAANHSFGRNSFGGRNIIYNGSSSRVDILQNVVIAEPFTLVTWCNPASVSLDDSLLGIADKDNGTNQHRIILKGASPFFTASTFDGVISDATGTTPVVADVDYLVAGVFASASSRKIYVNGVQEGANTQTRAVSGLDRMTFGTTADSTPFGWWDGSIWGTLLYKGVPSDEVLYSLYDPASRWDLYKPQSRTSYYWIPSPVSTISLPLTQIRKPRRIPPRAPISINKSSSLSKDLAFALPMFPFTNSPPRDVGPSRLISTLTAGTLNRVVSADLGVEGIDFLPALPYFKMGDSDILGTLPNASLFFWVSGVASGDREQNGNTIYTERATTTPIWDFATHGQSANPSLMVFVHRDNSGTLTFLYSNSSIEDGGLHLVGITKNGQEIKFYIDGQLDNTGTLNGNDTLTLTGPTFGIDLQSTTTTELRHPVYHGAGWKRTLTEAECWQMFNPATRWDLYESSRPRILTIPGAVVAPTGFFARYFYDLLLAGR